MGPLPHILIVDDHAQIRESVARFLEKNGMRTTVARDAVEMDAKLATGHFDLLVLDVMMPGEDGLSVCRRLAPEGDLPIIMLTARDQLADKLAGFDVGADDYLVKPFELQELAVRIEALIRREKGDVSETVYQIADLKLDTDREIAFMLIDGVDDDGYLHTTVEDVLDQLAHRTAGPLVPLALIRRPTEQVEERSAQSSRPERL